MKKISIIIISYNRAEDTLALLHDIWNLHNTDTLLHNVVIINNASTTDYSAIKALSFANKQSSAPGNISFQYVESEENLGVSRGRNFAVQFAEGDLLTFFDDDVVIEDKDILTKIVRSFEADTEERKIGAVSFKVLYDSTGDMQVNAFPHKNFREYKDKQSFLTYYYTGCAHAFTKEAWNKAGYYPVDFFYGMEEYDQSYRLLDAGYAISYSGSVVIRHKESPLGRKPKSEKLRMMWVNKSKVAWKYLPLIYFITTVIMWSVEYLRKTGFALKDYMKGWKDIIGIPFKEKRTPLKKKTMAYLKMVKARLWY